ncbi:hypothetical protein P2P08_23635 [Escherichia coli]
MVNLERVRMIPACRSDDNDFESIKGKFIGCGHARCVFEVTGCDDLVLKEAKPDKYSHNENEARFYFMSVIDNLFNVLGCIAEVKSISRTGKFLIMEKLNTDLDTALKSDVKVPVEVDDKHSKNYGMTSDRKVIKCIDYGSVNFANGVSGKVKDVPFQSKESVDEMAKFKLTDNDLGF